MMKNLLSAIGRLRALRRDERGNVAILLAVSVVPLSLASMGAIDLTRGVAAKVELQDALDTAALAAGRSSATDNAGLTTVGQRILNQNLSVTSDLTLVGSSFTLGADNRVVASVQARFTPMVAGLIGSGPMTVQATTEVVRANNMLEIAMVLDNTGSMSDPLGSGGSKIGYLRTAAANFVDTMAKAAGQSSTPNSVKIALVPFSNMVKVGNSYASSGWIDQLAISPINNEIFTTGPGSYQAANRLTLFAQLGVSWGGCVENRRAPNDIQDTPPSATAPETLFTPAFAPDEADGVSGANDYVDEPTKDGRGNSLTWWARQGSVAKYSNRPKVTLNSSRGPNAGCSMQAIQRLTTDFSGLKSSINAMGASGDTNIPIGLAWGWYTLSPKAPFSDGVAYLTPKHKKIVVLMTDGQNTMTPDNTPTNNSSYSGEGYVWQGRVIQADGTPLTDTASSSATRTAAMNDRMKKLCSNMKDPSVDIEIYTIGVGVTNSSRTLLQACASGADHYFDVTSGSDLNGTFQSIANQIAQLHLAK
jgi:Flp pilus assembly protein TadG